METPRDRHLAEVESCGKLATLARMSKAGAQYDHERHMLVVKQGGWGPFDVSGEAVHLLVEAVGPLEAWRMIREETTPAGKGLQFNESVVALIDKVGAPEGDPDA